MKTFNCGRMAWTPLKAFGAEVGFDLSERMTDEETACFVTLFDDYDLLVFHEQNLSEVV